ncbi:hypothetical protein J6590_054649 [Homalodisca vitripennis]|nr:hypothetical protein J6590_054649 [Homalodisca vitripennis]
MSLTILPSPNVSPIKVRNALHSNIGTTRNVPHNLTEPQNVSPKDKNFLHSNIGTTHNVRNALHSNIGTTRNVPHNLTEPQNVSPKDKNFLHSNIGTTHNVPHNPTEPQHVSHQVTSASPAMSLTILPSPNVSPIKVTNAIHSNIGTTRNVPHNLTEPQHVSHQDHWDSYINREVRRINMTLHECLEKVGARPTSQSVGKTSTQRYDRCICEKTTPGFHSTSKTCRRAAIAAYLYGPLRTNNLTS